jgi:hypothetical protein
MNKLVGLVISTIAFAAPIAADASPVTWSFYETGIGSCGLPCVLPPQPFVLMTLTLPGPTSTGTAIWQGSPALPVYAGDSFALSLPIIRFRSPLTPAFAGAASNIGGRDCLDSGVGSGALCDFNISWAESAGVLTAISINVDAIDDNIGGLGGHPPPFFGLTGGPLASDFILGGCSDTQCTVAGFWQSDLAASIPEPMSAVLLITGLLGTCFASRSRLSG